MLSKNSHEVNYISEESKEKIFNEAFSICLAIFQKDISSGTYYNHAKYESLKAIVLIVLEKYGTDAIDFFKKDAIENGYNAIGNMSFSAKDMLMFFEAKKDKLEKYRNDKKNYEKDAINKMAVSSIIPEVFSDDSRITPNAFLRSSLFGIVKTGGRVRLENFKVHSMSQYEIFYTGEQLDQNDLNLFDALVFMSKMDSTEVTLESSLYNICNFMGIYKSKSGRDAIKDSIIRLTKANIEIRYQKMFYYGSILNDFYVDKKTGKLFITFNKKILSIFATNDYTIRNIEIKRELGKNQLASWLFNFYETHQNPMPFKIEFLKNLCGSGSEMKIFKFRLVESLNLIKEKYKENNQDFYFEVKNDSVFVSKNPQSFALAQ